MAPQVEDRTLRAVNCRLKNTSNTQLPRILGPITSQLVSSKCDISSPSSTEATWLKTRITSLLQERTQESRFCGVVLAKTCLDLGGPNLILQDKDRMTAWTRSLLDLIKKPGPVTTKACAVVAVTKVFVLTWGNATVVRELTTPMLPPFITICLQLLQGASTQAQSQLVEFVLESFATLLPRHPTVFRSYASQIRSSAMAILCTDPANENALTVATPETKDAASQVLVLLHQTAQKGGGAAEREKGLDELVSCTHATLDQVFRAVSEDWQSVAGVRSTISSSEDLPEEPTLQANEHTGFTGFQSLQSGIQRVKDLLSLLQAYISTPSASTVRIPLGRIVDLLTRLLYVQAPRIKDAMGTRYNLQIGREERDELLVSLPDLHVSTLQMISVLLERLNTASLPICAHFIDLITWLFQAESWDANLRAATYTVLAQLVSLAGPTLGKSTVKSLNKIIQACCRDLLPQQETTKPTSEVINAQLTNVNGNGTSKNGTTTATPTSSSSFQSVTATAIPALHTATSHLLPILYTKLPTTLIPKATRTLMDRTSILTQNIDALAASVLNPAPGKASLLPFLSAIAPGDARVEAVLRPRLPVILHGRSEDGVGEEGKVDAEDEMEEDEVEDEDHRDEGLVEDEKTYEPKVIDWAAVSAAKAKEQELKSAPAQSFGNLANIGDSTAPKRSADQVEMEASSSTANAKKPRIFDGDEEDEVVTRRPVPKVLDEPQVLSAAPTVAKEEVPEESDDEDGSDFEIPALVMKTDFDEDEDVDEE